MNTSFIELSENVSKLMEIVFERMRSPEERDLSALVAKEQGGLDDVLKNDKLLEEVLAKHKRGSGLERDKDEKWAKKSRRALPGQAPDAVQTVTDLRREVNKDVEQVLEDNELFDQKFEAMKKQVDEVIVTVKHESDRVIDTILASLAGPQERIVDRVSRTLPFFMYDLAEELHRTCIISGRRWYVTHNSSHAGGGLTGGWSTGLERQCEGQAPRHGCSRPLCGRQPCGARGHPGGDSTEQKQR